MAYFLRLIRLAVWFAVGLAIGGVSVNSWAETIPATLGPPTTTTPTGGACPWKTSGYCGATPEAAALAFWRASHPSGTCTQKSAAAYGGLYMVIFRCEDYQSWTEPSVYPQTATCPAGSTYNSSTRTCDTPGYTCPANQNWTLSGTTCTRPDCPEGQQRDETTGLCGCPVGKTLVGGMCVTLCPEGYHTMTPDNGQCEKDCFGDQFQASSGKCECLKGQKAYFSGTADQTATLQGGGDCQAGCQRKAGIFSLPLGAIGAATAGSASQWITPTTTTGATCQGASTSGTVKATLPPPAPVQPPTPEQPADPKATPDNNKDPENCANSGGVYMTVNGSGKCASPGPDNSSEADKLTTGKKESTTTNPDGSKITTKEETQTRINPVTGESETVVKKTEKTIGPNGEDLGTKTTESKGTGDKGGKNGDGSKGFCEENPQATICKKSTWTGDCESPPVCDGDAVQCATAKAVWEHRCVNKWAEKENELSGGVDQQNLFGDQAKIDAALNKSGEKDFDILATFQAKRQTYLTFASSCNPDLSFDFKGVHYQFDTTVLCQLGLVVKVLLHLAAYMALLRMLTVKLF